MGFALAFDHFWYMLVILIPLNNNTLYGRHPEARVTPMLRISNFFSEDHFRRGPYKDSWNLHESDE